MALATEAELIEAITHLAFDAGRPKAMSAMAVAKTVFGAIDSAS
jgi:4-carboxymuconolactone decarboxylase